MRKIQTDTNKQTWEPKYKNKNKKSLKKPQILTNFTVYLPTYFMQRNVQKNRFEKILSNTKFRKINQEGNNYSHPKLRFRAETGPGDINKMSKNTKILQNSTPFQKQRYRKWTPRYIFIGCWLNVRYFQFPTQKTLILDLTAVPVFVPSIIWPLSFTPAARVSEQTQLTFSMLFIEAH